MRIEATKLFRRTMCLAVFVELATGSLRAQSSLTLGWNGISDPTVKGYKLHYGAGSHSYSNVVSAGMATSAMLSNLNAGATYYFAVGSYGTPGIEGPLSTELSYTVPLARPIDPTVTLTAPANGATYTAPATMALTATVVANGHAITKVQFYNGTVLLGEASAAPFGVTWGNVPAGGYSPKARLVYDSGSVIDSTAANVTVANPAPVITISSPTDGGMFTTRAKVSFAASVAANGHTINKVGFYDNAMLIQEQTSAPYAVTLSGMSAGTHTLMVRATYDTTNSVTKSAAISVSSTKKSVVSIAAPAGAAGGSLSTQDSMASESLLTPLGDGERAVYSFTVPETGDYMLSALVGAPSAGENSFSLNIDAEPTDPMSIWNLAVTSEASEQVVTWQGVSAAVPKVFYLTAGAHQLVVRGREPNSQLGMISVWAAPFDARVTADQQVILSGAGQAGHTYDVQATTDMKTWTKVGSVSIAADGSFQFTDPVPATFASRSYRLVIR